jgi:putative peptidoglycan lipid II flippase
MLKSFLSVGGFTLLSRVTGFLRDIALGAILGAGLLADAFVVAQKLPNHFRAIFGEGAFNAAYVPSYARVLHGEGLPAARGFAGQVVTLLLLSQLVVLALAWAFTPELVDLLAPGFRAEPEKFSRTVALTQITFPYLLFVTLVTLQSATLNAHGRFAVAAFAPVLMNLCVIGALLVAFLFPDAAVAASVGLVVSGALQLAMTTAAVWKCGLLERFSRPLWTGNVRRFLAMLGPAVIGSAGTQIALFADTILASMLPTGGPSAIYYAERIYQLPIGVIGIAAGTVLLPEMSRLLAARKPDAAVHAQNRTMALTIALSAPFFIAFIMVPDAIMRGLFLRGAFTTEAVRASAAVLEAYGFGLVAMVLVRAAVASFQARGDTRTPMLISLGAVAVNVALKLVLFAPLGAVGLATATAIGAWTNLVLLVALATRHGTMKADGVLWKTGACVTLASLCLAILALTSEPAITHFAGSVSQFGNELTLLLLGLAGALVYSTVLLVTLRIAGVRLRHPSGQSPGKTA